MQLYHQTFNQNKGWLNPLTSRIHGPALGLKALARTMISSRRFGMRKRAVMLNVFQWALPIGLMTLLTVRPGIVKQSS